MASDFVFGYPNFDKVEIAVSGGKFVIERENKGQQNNYIQGIVLNGTEYKKPWIEYADIMKGGELKFLMGDEPVVWY